MTTTINGRYQLEGLLGQGGMAEVFSASVLGADGFAKKVAIKRVRPGYSDDPTFAKMFSEEAKLTSKLRHSNLVAIHDFDRDVEGRYFLVMELVEGVDLDAFIEAGPLPFSLVIYLAIEILRGLDYMHELPGEIGGAHGVVHRDISPHNILLAWDGAVKLADFGIAKSHRNAQATASVMIKGKPMYMSPEQARGGKLDGRSDLFAVGVMLFKMLCLTDLFAAESLEGTLWRVVHDPIPHPRQLRPEIPEDLAQVVLSMLQRDVDQRVPSAIAALNALVSCNDCPKDGRAELITLLAHRFPGRAPVRARHVSHSSHQDLTAVPLRSPSGVVPARSAPTRTAASQQRTKTELPPARPDRQRRRLPLIAGVIVLAASTGIVLSNQLFKAPAGQATKESGGSGAPSSPAAAPPPPSMAAAPLTTRDAAVPLPAPDAAAPVPPLPEPAVQAAGSKSSAVRGLLRPSLPAEEPPASPLKQPAKRQAPRPSGIRAVTIESQ